MSRWMLRGLLSHQMSLESVAGLQAAILERLLLHALTGSVTNGDGDANTALQKVKHLLPNNLRIFLPVRRVSSHHRWEIGYLRGCEIVEAEVRECRARDGDKPAACAGTPKRITDLL